MLMQLWEYLITLPSNILDTISNYIKQNPGMGPVVGAAVGAIVTSVMTLLITSTINSGFKRQKEIEVQYRGKEYLMQKKLDVYEEITTLLHSCRAMKHLGYQDYKDLVDVYAGKKFKGVEPLDELSEESYIRLTNHVYNYYDNKHLGLEFVFEEDKFKEVLARLEDLVFTKGVYMSKTVSKELKNCLMIIRLFYAYYTNIDRALSKYSPNRDYKGYLRPKLAFIMKDYVLFYSTKIDKLVVKELRNPEMQLNGLMDFSFKRIPLLRKINFKTKSIYYTKPEKHIQLLIDYCGDRFLTKRNYKFYTADLYDLLKHNTNVKG